MRTDDIELVQQYARNHSEEAFATLVSRHINLVYSTALRQVGNPFLAEEITQVVFTILARKAGSLGEGTILSGWLCRTARYTAANALTVQRRRQHHEQEAQEMQSILNEPEPNPWTQIAPLLDTALGQLRETDQNAIALRFFENKSFSEVALALGGSEDAAKMRVGRALEKLRKFFAKRGFTLSAAVIAAAVSANSVQAAPPGLAATVATSAVDGLAAGTSSLTLLNATLKLMSWLRAKTAIGVGAGAVVAAGIASVSVSIFFQRAHPPGRVETATVVPAPPVPGMGGAGSVAVGAVMAPRMMGGGGGVALGSIAAAPIGPPPRIPAWVHVSPAATPSTRTIREIMNELDAANRQFDGAVDDSTIFAAAATRKSALPAARAAANHMLQLHEEMTEVAKGPNKVGMTVAYANISSTLTILKLALDDPTTTQDIARAMAAGGDDASLAQVLRAVANYFQAGQNPDAQLRAVEQYAQAAPALAPNAPVMGLPSLFSHNPPANDAVAARLVAVLQSEQRYSATIGFIVRGLTDPTLIAQFKNQNRPYFASSTPRAAMP
jgi:RNA polymerase sigma factor (sigma-70 family)